MARRGSGKGFRSPWRTKLRYNRTANGTTKKRAAMTSSKRLLFPLTLLLLLCTGAGLSITVPQGRGNNATGRDEPRFEVADIAEKVTRLMDTPAHEAHGEPYTDADVARLSFGELEAKDVEAIRTGALPNPSVDQITALSDVFGVDPSYFVNRTKSSLLLDRNAMEIFRDETVSAIAHRSLRLPGRERQMILNIIRQFEDSREGGDDA